MVGGSDAARPTARGGRLQHVRACPDARHEPRAQQESPDPRSRRPHGAQSSPDGHAFRVGTTTAATDPLSGTCDDPSLGEVELIGPWLRLPDAVPLMRVRFQLRTGSEWLATAGSLDVTEFGAVGEQAVGSFDVEMSARLNQDPVLLHGDFRAERDVDRFSP